jgi:hypothetical protein
MFYKTNFLNFILIFNRRTLKNKTDKVYHQASKYFDTKIIDNNNIRAVIIITYYLKWSIIIHK